MLTVLAGFEQLETLVLLDRRSRNGTQQEPSHAQPNAQHDRQPEDNGRNQQ